MARSLAVTLLTRILEVLRLNLGGDTGYPDSFLMVSLNPTKQILD
jgi:hypothetical protein